MFSVGTCLSQNNEINKKIYTIDVRADSSIRFSNVENAPLFQALKEAVEYKDQFVQDSYPTIEITIVCFISQNGELDSVFVNSKNSASKFYEKQVKNTFNQTQSVNYKADVMSNHQMSVIFRLRSCQDIDFHLFGFVSATDLRNKIVNELSLHLNVF